MRAETPPELSGFSHVSVTVSDIERSVAWYRDVLGFTVVSTRNDGVLSKAMLQDPSVTVMLVLVGHHDRFVAGAFSEFRTGLDHLAFAVRDRAALQKWSSRLTAFGVAHSPITRGSIGELICFRDPDNIALEFYTRA